MTGSIDGVYVDVMYALLACSLRGVIFFLQAQVRCFEPPVRLSEKFKFHKIETK